jgi:hypothetical protein
VIDRIRMEGSVNFIGDASHPLTPEEGAEVLAARPSHPELAPHPALPEDTRLWAALQSASGGTWGGCVYDVDAITKDSARNPQTLWSSPNQPGLRRCKCCHGTPPLLRKLIPAIAIVS